MPRGKDSKSTSRSKTSSSKEISGRRKPKDSNNNSEKGKRKRRCGSSSKARIDSSNRDPSGYNARSHAPLPTTMATTATIMAAFQTTITVPILVMTTRSA